MIATACGYSFPQIDAMTMAEVEVLTEYWRNYPPVHVLAAAWMGYKARLSQPAPDLMALLGTDPTGTGAQMMTLH